MTELRDLLAWAYIRGFCVTAGGLVFTFSDEELCLLAATAYEDADQTLGLAPSVERMRANVVAQLTDWNEVRADGHNREATTWTAWRLNSAMSAARGS